MVINETLLTEEIDGVSLLFFYILRKPIHVLRFRSFKGTVSRDVYILFEGLNILISTFVYVLMVFKVFIKAFHYPIQFLTF